MSDDTVLVRPVRTFLEGADLVHPESEPYRVSRSRMIELRGNGLVEHVEGEAEPEAPDTPPAAPEVPSDPAAPRKRGRPPKAR